jgi:hypothetical protein
MSNSLCFRTFHLLGCCPRHSASTSGGRFFLPLWVRGRGGLVGQLLLDLVAELFGTTSVAAVRIEADVGVEIL